MNVYLKMTIWESGNFNSIRECENLCEFENLKLNYYKWWKSDGYCGNSRKGHRILNCLNSKIKLIWKSETLNFSELNVEIWEIKMW